MNKPSQIRSIYNTLDKLPAPLKARGFSLVFGQAVKFFRTCGLRFEIIEPNHSKVTIKNIKRVQNHIGGIHAVGMAMIAESATGALVGLNVPATAVPVIKHMEIDYLKRAKGDMTAEAMLTDEQIEAMQSSPKGEVNVAVTITDSERKEPIFAQMIWAWTPKR